MNNRINDMSVLENEKIINDLKHNIATIQDEVKQVCNDLIQKDECIKSNEQEICSQRKDVTTLLKHLENLEDEAVTNSLELSALQRKAVKEVQSFLAEKKKVLIYFCKYAKIKTALKNYEEVEKVQQEDVNTVYSQLDAIDEKFKALIKKYNDEVNDKVENEIKQKTDMYKADVAKLEPILKKLEADVAVLEADLQEKTGKCATLKKLQEKVAI